MHNPSPISRRGLLAILLVLVLLTMACGAGAADQAAQSSNNSGSAQVAITEAAPAETEAAPAETEIAATEAPSGSDQPAAPADGQAATADSGFRPDVNGFSFENYGNDQFQVTNLTEAEMERMFGPQVCASDSGGQCILTPPAQRWMDEVNKTMAGGHCEGFSVLSALMYYGAVDPNQFGGATASELQIQDNEALQREIAYWFTTQFTQPANNSPIDESPKVVVDTLLQVLSEGKRPQDEYAIGIFKRDHSGGHSILPIGVDDKGNGLYDILVYDNNYPGQTRTMAVDTNANTWEYEASINPSEQADLYEGDADTRTLSLNSISMREGEQVCDFCAGTAGRGKGVNGVGMAAAEYYEITLDGPANLLITTEDGQRIGYDKGKFVNEVKGATTEYPKLGVDVWNSNSDPVYRVPAGKAFTIAVDASELTQITTNTVTMIGPGFFMAVDNIDLDPGAVDQIGLANDGNSYGVSYKTDYSQTPEIYIGIETPQADYAFMADAAELQGDSDTLNIGLNLDNQTFVVTAEGNTQPGTYDFYVLRIDDQGEAAFGTDNFQLDPGATVYLDYSSWKDNGTPMTAQLDTNGDGQSDQTIELPDQTDQFIW